MANSIVVGTLRALLTADTAEFSTAMGRVGASVEQWSSKMGQVGRQMTTIGSGLTASLTVPILGLGTAAAKSAIDFESSFAGVRKTVDATDVEFQQMAAAFRNLAKEIPVNVNELNRFGEAAGALGIPKAEIVDFSRVMALLGVTTNVTGDQAAESIAQIQTQFQAAGKETENFASALVHLGNNGASTEAQILELASRLASAGQAAGMSQADVLGFSAAMANVGIEAQAGGTALGRTFNEINAAVATGGDAVKDYARIAGMSVDDFSKKFKVDAAGAVQDFIAGLGRVESEGGNLITTMNDLGITEIRQSDTLRRLAMNTDNVTNALRDANKGWSENSALSEEARKRFETVESKLSLLWGRLKDVAITFGNALLPVIEMAIKALDKLIPYLEDAAEWFGTLPDGVKAVAVGIALLVAAIGPVLVVLGTLVASIGALLPVLGSVASALGVGALAVASFGLAIGPPALLWQQKGEEIQSTASRMIEGVKHFLVDVFHSDVVQSIVALLQAMGEFYLAAFTRIITEAGLFMAGIRDWLIIKLDPIIKALQPILEGMSAIWRTAKDVIVAVAQALYEGVKAWLVDKFSTIVSGITGLIDKVTDHFRTMKDLVVGHSYVPDMIDGIDTEFRRLPDVMEKPAATATANVTGKFRDLKTDLTSMIGDMVGDLGQTMSGFLGGGGGGFFGNLVSGGLGLLFGPGGIVMDLVGKGLQALGNLVMSGLKKIGGFFKDLFGGPSAEELAGREIVHAFERNLSDMLSDMGKLEPGMESWEATVVAIRDAYLAAGRTEQEALDDAARLWASSREGAEASRRVVEEITRKMEGFGRSIREAIDEIPEEINIPVNFEMGDVPDMPQIPHFARGGIVTKPTVALIGESGPEMVTPLGRGNFGLSDGAATRRLEALIDRLEHVLPVAIRDAILQGA